MKRSASKRVKSFDFSKIDEAVQKAIGSVPEESQALMKWKVPTLARWWTTGR